jgi:hypothetical protein
MRTSYISVYQNYRSVSIKNLGCLLTDKAASIKEVAIVALFAWLKAMAESIVR